MIIVTGGSGFIGSNIVKGLNEMGRQDIIVVDDLGDGRKFRNLVDCEIQDYIDKDSFIEDLRNKKKPGYSIETVFHQGACSSTTEWDGRYMMENNYDYSKRLLEFCSENDIAFLYASSASVYGGGNVFSESRDCEAPLNVYGYSKFLFDQYVRRILPAAKNQVAGFRYFNVYGPREQHKGSMASVAFHFSRQVADGRNPQLFEGSDGYEDGEQRRDFVYVDDVVNVNLWFMSNPSVSGIFNVGTGKCQSFNAVARAVIDWYGRGEIDYIPFPDNLRDYYQSFTEADTRALRTAGYNRPFKTVEEGVPLYMEWLKENS